MSQKFKGDAIELKMELAASPAVDLCGVALDDFYANGFESDPFLLMLYDNGRMPFSDRVPRGSFVLFIKEALLRFPVTGTFDAYLFILNSIFGDGSGVLFDTSSPGTLSMLVNASSSLSFDFVGREIVDGEYVFSDMETQDGDLLQFRGISGIDSAAKLTSLLSELIPSGIYPDITLAFFSLYDFISEDGLGTLYNMVDHIGNQIVFFET